MIEPYQAIGLVPTMWGIRKREDIRKNLEHLDHLVTASTWLGGLDLPVRLVAVPEGALQGFNDEVLDLDHETFARECAIDIPGPETDELGRLARKWGVFVMAQAKARHPEFPGRFFNVGFVLDPDGEVVLRHHKVVPLLPVEHSMTPHNVYDRWIELYGNTLDAFYPVAETEIGRLGIMMANEGSYPENARGLAMNGAEVVYRASFPHRASDAFEVQTRARALDNNFYVIAPNVGTYYLMPDDETPIDTFGGHSLIVDYLGRKMGELTYSGASSWVAGTIDIHALRHFRANAKWGNWMKDLTTEQYRLIYEQPIYPKNLYAARAPYKHAEYHKEVLERQRELLRERGVYAPQEAGTVTPVADS
jgi:predicted amidohydrolase